MVMVVLLTHHQGSKYDYVMWRLMHTGPIQSTAKGSVPEGVPLVIKTKHQADLSFATAGQAISYFSYAKQGINNYSGVIVL